MEKEREIKECLHSLWTAKYITLSNGRITLREFCTECGCSSGGSRFGYALPMVSDLNLCPNSFKYKNKTLGEIFASDPKYLLWLITDSKASSRVKKAAARVYCGKPYASPLPGTTYVSEQNYFTALKNSTIFLSVLNYVQE